MPFSVSMFLFEIAVEELNSYTDCKEFYIKSKFADIFSFNLKYPNNDSEPLMKVNKTKKKKVRNTKASLEKLHMEGNIKNGQFQLYNCHKTMLITAMKQNPIELSLYDKDNPKQKLGCAHIPWSPIFTDYLSKLGTKRKDSTAQVCTGYNIYDDFSSRCFATIRLNIKLTHLRNETKLSYLSLYETKQNTCMYPGFISKPKSILNTIKEVHSLIVDETGPEKTVKSGGKNNVKTSNKIKISTKRIKDVIAKKEKEPSVPSTVVQNENVVEKCKIKSSKLCFVRSDSNLDKKRQNDNVKTKSCTSINSKHCNILKYVFGDSSGPFFNRVYRVGYFTVENDFKENENTSKGSSQRDLLAQSPDKSVSDADSKSKKESDNSRPESKSSLDIPAEAANLITITKCINKSCDVKDTSTVPQPPDESIVLDLSNIKKDCCRITDTEVVGGMQTRMKYDEATCSCSCECTFGLYKRQMTYCGVCGGYEDVGDFVPKKDPTGPFPCPAYYKLIDKNKPKASPSGSDRSRLGSGKKGSKSPVSGKSGSFKSSVKSSVKSPGASGGATKDESGNETGSLKKTKKDDRFKFNYGFTGIPPKIGHSDCATPCHGTLGNVPKTMGWLWTAEDVPGITFHPDWRPGATHKFVVRALKMAMNPGVVLNTKKKNKDALKKKKGLKRPLITVSKKDGEYTVTMETMKFYPNERAPNQQPYEEKPLVTYTIERTEEENRERQKKKEREQRRLERDKRAFIQSAFNDMCNEICLKTYQQALGLLPDAEDPDCLCYPKNPGPEDTNLDRSCSCSEASGSLGSETDSDEWIVEFTPPSATYDPTYKKKPNTKEDKTTQYTYLDYRVKLLDKFGNQVPRYFKGPDGKKQCSDLGGFWSHDHKWLEINFDGYIGPDERWAPMDFIGPNGEEVNCTSGKFQTENGVWLVVGEDGFIDSTGRWRYYSKANRCKKLAAPSKKQVAPASVKKGTKGTQC